MSSATSTDAVRLPSPELRPGKPDTTADSADRGLQPWQFFVLAALICATGVTYMVRGQGVTTVLLLSVLMLTTASVGLAVLRTVRPLVTKQEAEIKSGALHPFAGPVVDQDGKTRVPAGRNMTDDELGKMDYYVEGVASKLPKN